MRELIHFTAARTAEVVELHSEVFREFEECGIADVVSEHAQELAGLPAKYALPSIDSALNGRWEVESQAEAAREGAWSLQQHRSDLGIARRAREQAVLRAVSPHSDSPSATQRKGKPRGTTLRYFGASLQVLGGTVLAAANPLLGAIAGLASSFATMGAAAVPAYVGVAASVGTGLATAGAGLGLIGTIQKDREA